MTPEIRKAAELLRAGGLVAFPTETVYGLGADASNAKAVARLYAVKGRPADHPVIVHFAAADEAFAWAREIPQAARQLVAIEFGQTNVKESELRSELARSLSDLAPTNS